MWQTLGETKIAEELTARLGLLTADLRGTPAVLVLALLTAPSVLSCLGALGLSDRWEKGSSETGMPPGKDGLQSQHPHAESKLTLHCHLIFLYYNASRNIACSREAASGEVSSH